MSWDYRVIEHECDKTIGGYTYAQIHEVYYDDNGDPLWMTENACAPFGENETELAESLVQMQQAFEQPILKATVFDKESKMPTESWR